MVLVPVLSGPDSCELGTVQNLGLQTRIRLFGFLLYVDQEIRVPGQRGLSAIETFTSTHIDWWTAVGDHKNIAPFHHTRQSLLGLAFYVNAGDYFGEVQRRRYRDQYWRRDSRPALRRDSLRDA